jgi:outer membrane protein assembly factor BamE (lipoprotein component of BamABCDE complex)
MQGHMSAPVKISIALLVTVSAAVFLLWHSMTWSERLLNPIHEGMTQTQVRSLVGSPLRIDNRTNATDAWYYDRWWSSDAVVYFDTNRIVFAIETD